MDGDGHDGEPAGGDDCNDSNPEVNPDVVEICYDNLDNDCDGLGGSDDTGAQSDCDGDGTDREDDCDDTDPSAYPGAPDAWYDGVDSDCHSDSDYDQDLDGEDSVDGGGADCNDLDPAMNPAAAERWNGFDDDCDGGVDQLSTSDSRAGWHGEYSSLDLYLGYDFVLTPDLDGDGLDDVAIGSPGTGETVAGAVYVMATASSNAPSSGSLATITGSTTLLGLGLTTLPTGQLAVAAYGEAYVFDAAQLVGAVATATAAATLSAGNIGMLSDWSGGIATIGGPLSASSGVTVWSAATLAAGGAIPSSAASFTISDGTGSAGGGFPGDLDGDGLDDLAYGVTVLEISAKLALVSGELIAAGGTASADDTTSLTGIPLVDGTDGSVRVVGGVDYDGDGYRELTLGVLGGTGGAEGSGVAYLIDGDHCFEGGKISDIAETRVDGPIAGGQLAPAWTSGDVDGDGTVDLVLGFPGSGADSVTSEVWFVRNDVLAARGAVTPAAGNPNFRSGAPDDRFGYSIRMADPDQDGDDDLFVSTLASYGALNWFERE
ncbi:MAG: hypothetical protein EXR69_02585 [Myxococcales bacterium]|nr:hypothetical protein [Myxococcales bacterium]